MISQAQKIDCRAFVDERYFCFFRNRLYQQNHICHSNYIVKQPKISRISFVRPEPHHDLHHGFFLSITLTASHRGCLSYALFFRLWPETLEQLLIVCIVKGFVTRPIGNVEFLR